MSQLYAFVLSTLAEKEFHANQQLKRLTEFEVLHKRRLFDYADRKAKESKKEIDEGKQLDLWKDYYDLRIRFFRLISNHPDNISFPNRQQFIADMLQSLQLTNSTLSKYLLAEVTNLSELFDSDYSREIEYLEKLFIITEDPLQHLLDDQIDFIRNHSLTSVNSIFDRLLNNSESLSDSLKTTFYIRLRKYFLNEARKGNNRFIKQLAQIIIWSTEHNELIEGMNTISPNRFISDINILCFLNEVGRAQEYCDRNIGFIESKIKKQIESICLMMIEFSSGNYEQAIVQYNTTAFNIVTLKNDAYNVMLKSAYEFGYEYEELANLLRNYRTFMNRNKAKVSMSLRNFYNNFIKGYKYLLEDQSKLVLFLDQDIPIKDRHWLKEKMLEK